MRIWDYDTTDNNPNNIVWIPDNEYNIYAQAMDVAGNLSTEETCDFTFIFPVSETNVSINLSAQRILFGDTLDVSGKLTPKPNKGLYLTGHEITIEVTSPSGLETSYQTNTNVLGQYTLTDITGFNEGGTWKLNARFDGVKNLYNGSDSLTASLLVGESAGYAIIIEGRLPNGEGIQSHNKTTNRIYDKFIERNFDAEDIYYFNYDTSQTGVDGLPKVDGLPTRAGIKNTIEIWARDKNERLTGAIVCYHNESWERRGISYQQ